jgi:hypothetical protein
MPAKTSESGVTVYVPYASVSLWHERPGTVQSRSPLVPQTIRLATSETRASHVWQVTYKTPVPMAGVFSFFHTLFARTTLYLPRPLAGAPAPWPRHTLSRHVLAAFVYSTPTRSTAPRLTVSAHVSPSSAPIPSPQRRHFSVRFPVPIPGASYCRSSVPLRTRPRCLSYPDRGTCRATSFLSVQALPRDTPLSCRLVKKLKHLLVRELRDVLRDSLSG